MPPAPPKCPRCGAAVTGAADDLGFLNCGGCGARLRKAPTVKVTIQSPSPTTAAGPVPASSTPPPSMTGNRDTDSTDSLLARIERVDPGSTLPPGMQSSLAIRAVSGGKDSAVDALKATVQTLQKQVADLKESHEALEARVARLEKLPKPSTATQPPSAALLAGAAPRPPAAPGGRTVVIVEDDAALAEATRKACEKLGFAPFVATAVRAALDAMGKERPALLILEPLLAGELSGRDLVNYVKSTMEWVEIPILIHTRAAVANHEQARTDFGADDFVIKGEGSIELLEKKIARLTA